MLIILAAFLSFSNACGESAEDSQTPPSQEEVEEEGDKDKDEDKDKPVGPVTRETFPQAYAEIICGRIYTCCADTPISGHYSPSYYESEEDCQESFGARKEMEINRADVSRDAGRMVFDTERAEQCLSELQAASCAEGLTDRQIKPESCALLDIPQVDVGEECALDQDCRSGRCDGGRVSQEGEAYMMGTCQAVQDIGEACEWQIDCRPGTICSAKYDPTTGERDGVCREYKIAGEPCSSGIECGEGTYCSVYDGSGPTPAEGVCKAIKAPGEACIRSMQCGDDFCESAPDDPGGARTCSTAGWLCLGL